MENFKTIQMRVDGNIAIITLNRPQAANGLNTEMADELNRAARICDNDSAIKAVLLSAEGRFFCAGGDIKEFADQGESVGSSIKALADDLHAAISTFSRMDAAFIVAVNGIAAGAGFSLAIAADLVIAARSASFTMAYTKAGLCPDGSSSYFLPRLVGLRKAQELMLLNTRLSAEEAHDIGLVTRVCDDESLQTDAMQLAKELANASLQSTASVKKLLLSSFTNTLETQMEIEGRAVSQCASGLDGQEGIAAFIEKRAPEFK